MTHNEILRAYRAVLNYSRNVYRHLLEDQAIPDHARDEIKLDLARVDRELDSLNE